MSNFCVYSFKYYPPVQENSSPSDVVVVVGVATTAVTFAQRTGCVSETDTALAALYAHVSSMPDGEKKRKLIKKVRRGGRIVNDNMLELYSVFGVYSVYLIFNTMQMAAENRQRLGIREHKEKGLVGRAFNAIKVCCIILCYLLQLLVEVRCQYTA